MGLGPNAEGATEICEMLNSSTRKVIAKRDGKILFELNSTVSADGKVMTNTVTGNRAQILVYERQ